MNNSEIGFVLGVVPYREHDAMIHFLGENVGLIRLVLPGYYKSTSKQASLGLEFSKVNYRFNFQSNRLNRITGGELIDASLNKRQDFDWLLWMSFISELIIRTYDDDYRNSYVKMMLESLDDLNPTRIVHFLSDIIEMQGFSVDVGGCAVCGNPGINCFSIPSGGFLCGEHAPENVRDDKTILLELNKALRHLDFEMSQPVRVLKILLNFLEFHGDYRFNSWQLIEKVII